MLYYLKTSYPYGPYEDNYSRYTDDIAQATEWFEYAATTPIDDEIWCVKFSMYETPDTDIKGTLIRECVNRTHE